ncbi:hypothetical protein B0H21DRAFT_885451 [Amylocystis lapponica]|nr:hypothetical protein B0H21DRAFT_885451 [Amylocystis lapponica]
MGPIIRLRPGHSPIITLRRTPSASLSDHEHSDPPFGSDLRPRLPPSPSAHHSDDGNGDVDEIPASTRRYATRPTNNPHPAASVGLQKRTRTEISSVAEDKRTKQATNLAEKTRKKEGQKQREEETFRSLAALEDQRLREDDQEVQSLARSTRNGFCEMADDADENPDAYELPERADVKKQPRLTATEKKNLKKKEVRDKVASAREYPAQSSHGKKRKPSVELEASAKSKKPKAAESAFVFDWREKIRGRPGIANSKSASSARSSSVASSSTAGRGEGHSKHQRSSSAVSITSGLNDEDSNVTVKKEIRDGSTRQRQIVEVIDLENDSDVTIVNKRQPRKPKSTVAPEKSLSHNVLPDWIKPVFADKLMPTLLDVYGACDDPWDIDGEDGDFFSLTLQDIVDKLCPREHYTIAASDRIYAIARQGIYNWRSEFQKAAIHVVKQAIKGKFGKSPRRSEVKEFVVDAIADDGAAYWGKPGENCSEALQSPYILETYASHLGAITGSTLDGGTYPGGALALSTAAVERAFRMHSTGVFVAGSLFSDENAGPLTRFWMKESVVNFLDKPHRFDRLLDKATGYMRNTRHRRGASRGSSSMGITRARTTRVVDPSSPMPSDDEGN